jgi:hypothetical protein
LFHCLVWLFKIKSRGKLRELLFGRHWPNTQPFLNKISSFQSFQCGYPAQPQFVQPQPGRLHSQEQQQQEAAQPEQEPAKRQLSDGPGDDFINILRP